MMVDYAAITEVPGSRLNGEQLARFVHRYAFCAAHTGGVAQRRVLEVACGPAIGLGALQAHGHAVTGLCYTPAVLQGAQAHYRERLPLVGGDAQRLPLADHSFDVVLCLEAIYYFPDLAAFLAEARRVLVPGGLLLIGWSNPDWPHFVPGSLSHRYPSAPELLAALDKAGFGARELFGAFPIHAAPARHGAVMRLRRVLLRTHLYGLIHPLADQIKRLVYGRLHTLPPELPHGMLAHTARQIAQGHAQDRLPNDRRDTVHRVLYALGRSTGARPA